ncbi:MAG: thioesterase family protein [Bacteroidales bacterium]|nr:thioesterase family protein [Bacteroidales bacterium]
MAEEIKIGMSNIARRMVTDQNTAAAYGTGAMAVFSTPAMISMMEEASFLLLKKLGYASVGTGVNIKHLRACLPGTEVWAEAVVEDIDRKAVTFSVTAYDSKGEIGKGTHSRFIIDPEKFMYKLLEAK